jgi:hypothetical protein
MKNFTEHERLEIDSAMEILKANSFLSFLQFEIIKLQAEKIKSIPKRIKFLESKKGTPNEVTHLLPFAYQTILKNMTVDEFGQYYKEFLNRKSL